MLDTNAMVDKMCAAWNLVADGGGHRVPVHRAGTDESLVHCWGVREESGSIGFAGHIPERDGLAAGLFLLEMLATEKISVNKIWAKLEKEFGPHRYSRYDAHYLLENARR